MDSLEAISILDKRHAHEKKTVLISMLLIGFFVLLPIPNDFLFIHDGPTLAIAIGLRVAVVILGYFYWATYRGRRYRTFALVIVPLLALVTLGMLVMLDLTRPRNYFFSSVPAFLIVAFYYFMMYSPLGFKVVPAVLITAEQIGFLLLYKNLPPAGTLTMALTLVILNVFGIVHTMTMVTMQKFEWDQEKRLRSEVRFKDALVNASFDALVLFRENRVVDCNQAFLDLVELTLDEAHTVPLTRFLYLTEEEKARLATQEAVQTTLYGNNPIPVEVLQRQMTMATLDYTCLIVRDRSDDDGAVSRWSIPDLGGQVAKLPLSRREKEIVERIVEGQTRFEIADELCISDETVKKHTANIYTKLDITSKVDLIHRVLEG